MLGAVPVSGAGRTSGARGRAWSQRSFLKAHQRVSNRGERDPPGGCKIVFLVWLGGRRLQGGLRDRLKKRCSNLNNENLDNY